METKDWILLTVPIISNGILLAIFSKIVDNKVKKINKRQDLRDLIIKEYWTKFQKLNEVFIKSNINAMKNPETVHESIEKIQNLVLEIVTYYDTNEFDLKVLSKMQSDFQKLWDDFMNTYNQHANILLPDEMKTSIGIKLQKVKEEAQKISKELRKIY